MRLRRIGGTVLWLVLVPLFGVIDLVLRALRYLVWRKPWQLLVVGGLIAGVSTSDLILDYDFGVWPERHVILRSVFVATWTLVFSAGFRSPHSWRLRRQLRHRRWFV